MTTRLTVQLLERAYSLDSRTSDSNDVVLFEAHADNFEEETLFNLVDRALLSLSSRDGKGGDPNARSAELQLSIQLFSDGDNVRPALHLTHDLLEKIAKVGASIDFDPYCY